MKQKQRGSGFFSRWYGYALLILGCYLVVALAISLFYGVLNLLYGNKTAEKIVLAVGAIVAGVYLLLGLIMGWKMLSSIQPEAFLYLPIVGWLIYLLVKGILSTVIGGYALPFLAARGIRNKILTK